MVTAFKESINKRLSRYEEDDLYMMATTVDPRFNSKERHSVEQTFIDLATVQEELYPLNSDPASPPPAKARKVEKHFFGFMSSPSNQQTPRVKCGGRKEIEDYLRKECAAMDSNPLLCWKTNLNKFPNIAKLASKYLAVAATSAPVERLFSVVGKTFRAERCSLKDNTFQNLMVIKCNHNILS